MKRFLLFLFLIVAANPPSFGQADSCDLRISLLTCAPGSELYSTFGHTALRVRAGGDENGLVFNYGSFEFGPDFYTEFIRGKLLYYLSVESYNDFIYQYRYESRSVKEQEIQLSCSAKQRLFNALMENSKEENRFYRYDFLFDNCTTRAGDMVVKYADDSVAFRNILPADKPSFRDLIHSYLDAGHQPWSKLGIDILLGAKLDREVSNREAMFLPDYLLKGFDSASVQSKPLVTPPQLTLDMPSPLGDASIFTPLLVFLLLAIPVTVLSFTREPWARKTMMVFDFLYFFILGLAGLLLVFMWFGTDHLVCRNNYNLLWALPTHAVMAFFVHSKKRWVQVYYRIVFWISILLALTWLILPQELNPALLPLLLIVIIRSWRR